MNNSHNKMYKISYRKGNIWKRINAIGHNYIAAQDRMDIYVPGGGIVSLAKWSNYDIKLGNDWVEIVKNQVEQKTGQDAKLKV